MRKSSLVGGLAAALASMVLVLPPPAPASAAVGDYSDLWVVLRDVNGVPELTTDTFYEEGGVTVTSCLQPISYTDPEIAFPEITFPVDAELVLNAVDGRMVYRIPLGGEGTTPDTAVPADTACAPLPPYVATEVDLERLNLARVQDPVLDRKIAEVVVRLDAADDVTLDGAGRITTWTGDVATTIDASPDQAAIYRELMETFKITAEVEVGEPPVVELVVGLDPAQITQGIPRRVFDEWMLAAAAVGTAAGKSVEITPDTIQYYNRAVALPGVVGDWADEVNVLPTTVGVEEFVDYTDFEYNRSNVFKGCTTWLDVPTLTWMSGPVIDRVEFTDVVEFTSPTDTVSNLAGFTQLADDVRSVINYLHENEVVVDPVTGEGFFIDPVFTDTCRLQEERVIDLNQPVDAVDPTVAITVAPAAETTSTTATFEFTATDAASVLCVLDSGAIERCTSPKTYTGLEPGTHTFNVIAMGVAGNFVSDTHTWTIVGPGEDSMIVSLDPVRFADTRPGWIAADGLFYGTGPVPAGRVVQVQIAGRGDVPFGAKAVVANVTVVGATIPGFATVFPCGTLPGTSSVNYRAGEAVANEVIAKLSPTGSICVYVHSAVNVIVDVAGYVPATSDYEALTPARLVDTRPTPVQAARFVEVPIVGRGGVPADAKAVVANVTVVGATIPGFATVFPCGTLPGTSSVNYRAGEAVANEVIAKLSPTGSICVYVHSAVNVIVDVAGYL